MMLHGDLNGQLFARKFTKRLKKLNYAGFTISQTGVKMHQCTLE